MSFELEFLLRNRRIVLCHTCKVLFGRNYLVRLRPFGRSCRAMELQRMNSLQGVLHRETNINNNDSSSINNINNIAFITYHHYCDRLYRYQFHFFCFCFFFPVITVAVVVSVFRHAFSLITSVMDNYNYHRNHCLQQHRHYC